MDLSQVGGDVSLGPLIICCYSQALVIVDKHPVSLRYSSNQVLLQPGKRTSGTKKSKEKKLDLCAYPGMTAYCTLHFYTCAFSIAIKLSTYLSAMIAGIQIVLGPYASKALKHQTYF